VVNNVFGKIKERVDDDKKKGLIRYPIELI